MQLALTISGLAVGALVALIVTMRVRRHQQAVWAAQQREDGDRPVCAKCGYSLAGLELPRCPECGALRGFNVPLEALGLTEEEVREGFARRRGVQADAEGDAKPASPTEE